MQGKLDFDNTVPLSRPMRGVEFTLQDDALTYSGEIRLPEEKTPSDSDPTLVHGGHAPLSTLSLLYIRLWNLMESYYRDPLAVFSSSRTMLLPHQVEAALRVVSASRPRFLIADEVGLGKTIEAGLILKELKLKHAYKKILIVVPSPLMAQWQQELKTKFAEDFVLLTGDVMRRELSRHTPSVEKNARHKKWDSLFETQSQFLVSVDLAKDERYLEMFLEQKFDLVVFDEAHRLRRDANTVTQAWQFAHALCRSVEGLLLLSATPFRGKLEEIYYLIHLLDADILGPLATFQTQFAEDASLLRDRLSPVVIRRRKVDVGGFTKRFAKTVKIDLERDERIFYDKMTEYVKNEFNKALSRGENLQSFIMIVFQKLLDSSTFALLRALEGRRSRLEGMYFRVMHEIHESEDVRDAVREYQEEEGFEESGMINPQELRDEIQHLTHLIQMGKKIQTDSKLKHLQKTLKSMRGMGHTKFVIFTQFKSTLEYLLSHLTHYNAIGFHGGLNFQQKEEAIQAFFADKDILICTEAGGEGRNLQIAACLINYDLPWSPLKLEQRIGRIHRFGQTKDVHIVNFACRDTVAERVLEVLEEKIRLFENALGPSDTLLGVFESEYKFARNLMAFLGAKKSKREHNEELERSLFLAKENLRNIDRLISTEHMNFNLAAFRFAHSYDTQKKGGEELKNLVADFAPWGGYTLKDTAGAVEIISCPKEGEAPRHRKGTFDQDSATKRVDLEFFALGHDFIDDCAKQIIAEAEKNPIVSTHAAFEGALLFLAVTVELDKSYRRLYHIFLERSGEGVMESKSFSLDELAACNFSESTLDKVSLEVLAKHAVTSLEAEIVQDIRAILAKVRPSENFWHHRIVDSAAERKAHIEEKLEIQRSKVHWYGEKYAGSVTKLAGEKRRSEVSTYERLQKSQSRLSPKITIDVRKVCLFNN